MKIIKLHNFETKLETIKPHDIEIKLKNQFHYIEIAIGNYNIVDTVYGSSSLRLAYLWDIYNKVTVFDTLVDFANDFNYISDKVANEYFDFSMTLMREVRELISNLE